MNNKEKLMSDALEIGVKFKDHIPQKRTLFSYECSGEPLTEENIPIAHLTT